MAEYWKSTPKYWCKFCEVYVRDTGIERKNHETSAKHQNSIQRSLRKLHNGQAQQQRDQQKAKSEVARLNGLVGSKGSGSAIPSSSTPVSQPTYTRPDYSKVDYDAHIRAQAQQLASMGMQLPESMRNALTGVGDWQVVSKRVVEDDAAPADLPHVHIKGVHKRKIEDDEEAAEETTANKRKVWGSALRTYTESTAFDEDSNDLDTLLSGINKKPDTDNDASDQIPQIAQDEQEPPTKREPIQNDRDDDVKQEDNESAITAPPVVTFKKRKAKR